MGVRLGGDLLLDLGDQRGRGGRLRAPKKRKAFSAQQAQWARLQELGLNVDSDFERSLGRRLIESIPDAG